MPDRRALSRCAAEPAPAERPQPAPALPAPLTAFVGRGREHAEPAAALRAAGRSPRSVRAEALLDGDLPRQLAAGAASLAELGPAPVSG